MLINFVFNNTIVAWTTYFYYICVRPSSTNYLCCTLLLYTTRKNNIHWKIIFFLHFLLSKHFTQNENRKWTSRDRLEISCRVFLRKELYNCSKNATCELIWPQKSIYGPLCGGRMSVCLSVHPSVVYHHLYTVKIWYGCYLAVIYSRKNIFACLSIMLFFHQQLKTCKKWRNL